MLKGERDKVGRDDMVTLSGISEGDIISNIQKRYTEGIIYVCILNNKKIANIFFPTKDLLITS